MSPKHLAALCISCLGVAAVAISCSDGPRGGQVVGENNYDDPEDPGAAGTVVPPRKDGGTKPSPADAATDAPEPPPPPPPDASAPKDAAAEASSDAASAPQDAAREASPDAGSALPPDASDAASDAVSAPQDAASEASEDAAAD